MNTTSTKHSSIRHHEALHYLLQVDLQVHFREKPTPTKTTTPWLHLHFVYKALFNRRKYQGSVFALAKQALPPGRFHHRTAGAWRMTRSPLSD